MAKIDNFRIRLIKTYTLIKEFMRKLWFEFIYEPYSEVYVTERTWESVGKFFELIEKEYGENTQNSSSKDRKI